MYEKKLQSLLPKMPVELQEEFTVLYYQLESATGKQKTKIEIEFIERLDDALEEEPEKEWEFEAFELVTGIDQETLRATKHEKEAGAFNQKAYGLYFAEELLHQQTKEMTKKHSL